LVGEEHDNIVKIYLDTPAL